MLPFRCDLILGVLHMGVSDWKEVVRKKHRSVFDRLKFPQSSVDDLAKISLTVYVSNFPSHFKIRELWNRCGKIGTLVDVYIAKHKNKLGQMFAFCRYIKIDEVINERFKIIMKGKLYWIRAKEMEAWEPNFMFEDEVDDLSSDGELFGEDEELSGRYNEHDHAQGVNSDVEKVSETSFTHGDDIVQDNTLNENETIHFDDPFEIYGILN
ncbi:RNA-directed DNA polymerase, eukaryota, partial [Tanacetum coccineum]